MTTFWGLVKAVCLSAFGASLLSGVRGAGSRGTQDELIAKTTDGLVRGKMTTNPYGDVIQYLGIPYAKPPVVDLRFGPPSPPDPWTGVLESVSNRSTCVQLQFMSTSGGGSEDCLYLNVHVPTHTVGGPAAVMVFVHGGGFETGAGSLYDASRLAAQGVIVVTFNYRLNVFGFLSTEDSAIPGNFGMMDQVLAFKWVQSNIAAFGGDPTRVTIFGQSAGACSVSLHLLSPLTEGLFARAIIQSGSSLSPWGTAHPTTSPAPKLVARLIGLRVGCTQPASAGFLKCLRQVTALTLYDAYTEIKGAVGSNPILMMPRVEEEFGFLPDQPIKLLRAGKFHHVNTLHGFNSHEMGFAYQEDKMAPMNLAKFRKAIMGELFSIFSGGLQLFAVSGKDLFVESVLEAYNVTEESTPEYIRDQVVQATSNLEFVGPTVNEIRFLAARGSEDDCDGGCESSKSNHYLYRFNYRPSFSFSPSWMGPVHGEETAFVFGTSPVFGLFGIKPSSKDRLMAEHTMTWWSNFAKTGNPNSAETLKWAKDWKPYTSDNDLLLQIDSNSTMAAFGRPEVVKLSLALTKMIDIPFHEDSSVIG